MRPLRVLFVEDSAADAELMLRALKAGGFDPVHERVETAAALRAALEGITWDVVLSDYYLPELEAPAALALVSVRLTCRSSSSPAAWGRTRPSPR